MFSEANSINVPNRFSLSVHLLSLKFSSIELQYFFYSALTLHVWIGSYW